MRVSRVFLRYLTFQTPGWAAAMLVVTLLRGYFELPLGAAAALFGLWVVKDLLMFRVLKGAYEVDERTVVERLIGEQGAAVNELAPAGYVRVRGELWRAEVRETVDPIAPGRPVVVTGVRDSILLVAPRARIRDPRALSSEPRR